MPHEPLTVGSLFSGIGGIDLGLERAGMVTRWFVEWDAHCQNVLRRHWPGVPVYGDITIVDWSGVEPVDVLAGGFPCQPVSQAGLRRGTSDERWLWPEFASAIRALRPRYVLVENVPGLLRPWLDRNGCGLWHEAPIEEVIADLAALGYRWEYDCIPAAAVGAPHIRDRVWIVAHSARIQPRRSEQRTERERAGSSGQPISLAYPDSESLGWLAESRGQRGQWLVEPDVGRVADGVPHRVDRLRALGNAVVPQVVEWIGRRIVAFDEERTGVVP